MYFCILFKIHTGTSNNAAEILDFVRTTLKDEGDLFEGYEARPLVSLELIQQMTKAALSDPRFGCRYFSFRLGLTIHISIYTDTVLRVGANHPHNPRIRAEEQRSWPGATLHSYSRSATRESFLN